MSALCQKQTFCAAKKMSLFDYLVGGRKTPWAVRLILAP